MRCRWQRNIGLAGVFRRVDSWSSESVRIPDRMWREFIIGVEPIENFDTYFETVKSMKIEEAVRITQDAYDSDMAKNANNMI